MNRREFVRSAALVGGASALAPQLLHAMVAPPSLTVYKSPSCGCCKEWVKHMIKAGFTVQVHDVDDVTEMKKTAGVPDKLASCHTALVGKYVIEGHVPADLVTKMLNEKATFLGLAVPGMVQGSPGMETGPKQPYQVLAFTRDGKSSVYASRS